MQINSITRGDIVELSNTNYQTKDTKGIPQVVGYAHIGGVLALWLYYSETVGVGLISASLAQIWMGSFKIGQ